MSSFPFIQLPAELRNRIYRHVLCYDGIVPKSRWPHNPWPPCNPRTQTSETPPWTLAKSFGSLKRTFTTISGASERD